MLCSGVTYTNASHVEEEDLGFLRASHFGVDDVQDVFYEPRVF